MGSLVHIFEQVDKNGVRNSLAGRAKRSAVWRQGDIISVHHQDGKIDFDEFFLMIRGVDNSCLWLSGSSAPSIKPGGGDSRPTSRRKSKGLR